MEHQILKLVNERKSKPFNTIKQVYDDTIKYRNYVLGQAVACDRYAQTGLFPLTTTEMKDDSKSSRYHGHVWELLSEEVEVNKYAFEPNASIGVNSMVAKIIEAIFPTVYPFFELKPSLKDQLKLAGAVKRKTIESVQAILEAQHAQDVQTAMLSGQLAPTSPQFDTTNPEHIELLNSEFERLKAEQRQEYNDYTLYAFDYFKKTFSASNQYMAILLYLVTGAFLLYMPPDPKNEYEARTQIKLIPIDKFTIVDSPEGEIVQICIREQYHVDALPDNLWEAVKAVKQINTMQYNSDDIVTIYELIRFKTGEDGKRRYYSEKEYEGLPLPGTYVEGDIDKFPYIINRPLISTTSCYGSPYMAQFIPILEDATYVKNNLRSMIQTSAFNTLMVDTTQLKSVEFDSLMSLQGKVIPVTSSDVKNSMAGVSFTMGSELQVAHNMYSEAIQVIQTAFMQNSSAQRDSERTTKGEIMVIIDELKQRMSLTYTQLEEFSAQIIKRCVQQMTHLKIWDLKAKVEPTITVGIGKIDLNQKADMFIEVLGLLNQLLSQLNPVLIQSLDINHFIDMVMASKGFQADMLLNSQAVSAGLIEQQKQLQQQQQMMQMMPLLEQLQGQQAQQ